MASQPVSGGQRTNISGGVGTAVISDSPVTLSRVFWGGTYVGTLDLHDAATTAGTSSTSEIVSIPIPQTTYPHSLEIGVQCQNGLVYEATGTPVMTVVWD